MAEIYLLIDLLICGARTGDSIPTRLGVRKAPACMGGTMVWNDIPA